MPRFLPLLSPESRGAAHSAGELGRRACELRTWVDGLRRRGLRRAGARLAGWARAVKGSRAGEELAELFHAEWGRLVATAMGLLGDLDRAEEVAQHALTAALERWPLSGMPERPGAWLLTTARNRAIDELRRDRRLRELAPRIAAEAPGVGGGEGDGEEQVADAASGSGALADERLRLIFVCCHPQIPREARVALTLRLLGGLSTREIAAAFLVPEATAAQRIVRAKRAVRDRRLPYRVPEADELRERLPAVLDVVYLIFNEGYASHEGDALLRASLCDEALRLGRLVCEGLPDEGEAAGLLALMELQASRRDARTDDSGELVLLEDQERGRWDRVRIERARRGLARALAGGELGPYLLQAAIAECHASAPSFAATDWRRIVGLYDALLRVAPSPVVELNRSVAIGMHAGPEAGLLALERVASHPKLRDYPRLPATRADFLRRLGRHAQAARDYRRAIALSGNARERAFLEGRLRECECAAAGDR